MGEKLEEGTQRGEPRHLLSFRPAQDCTCSPDPLMLEQIGGTEGLFCSQVGRGL